MFLDKYQRLFRRLFGLFTISFIAKKDGNIFDLTLNNLPGISMRLFGVFFLFQRLFCVWITGTFTVLVRVQQIILHTILIKILFKQFKHGSS